MSKNKVMPMKGKDPKDEEIDNQMNETREEDNSKDDLQHEAKI